MAECLKELGFERDEDATGKITFRDLKKAVTELGENISDEEIMEMIEEADRVGEQLAEAKRRGTITSGPLSSGKQRGRSSSKAFFSIMQAASQAPGGLAGSKRQRVADARKAAQGAGAADGASFKL